jgi:hypothetical protein
MFYFLKMVRFKQLWKHPEIPLNGSFKVVHMCQRLLNVSLTVSLSLSLSPGARDGIQTVYVNIES